ncbi:hypothetical protein KSS87_016343 [Heliosperma pusillum]|nr:hypothetical protein KSS87_016343 [Heliosperma pusillum]
MGVMCCIWLFCGTDPRLWYCSNSLLFNLVIVVSFLSRIWLYLHCISVCLWDYKIKFV